MSDFQFPKPGERKNVEYVAVEPQLLSQLAAMADAFLDEMERHGGANSPAANHIKETVRETLDLLDAPLRTRTVAATLLNRYHRAGLI